MRKQANVTSRQPQFVAPETVEKQFITFKRGGEQSKNQSYRLAKMANLENLLLDHFQQIGLIGEFTLMTTKRLRGNGHTVGIELQGVTENQIRLLWQATGDGVRFAFAILMPYELVVEAFEKLRHSIKNGLPKTDLETIDVKTASTADIDSVSVVESMPVQIVVPEVDRTTSVEVGSDLVIISFAGCVTLSAIPALGNALQAELRKFPHEGIFTVKCLQTVATQPNLLTSALILWCNLQPQARGLGFWHRESEAAKWLKYSLIAEEGFDIEELAEKLGKTKDVNKSISTFANPSAPRLGLKDYRNDVEVIREVLLVLARRIVADLIEVVTSEMMTQAVRSVIHDDINPSVIGHLAGDWVSQGYLWKRRASPNATYYVYGIGLLAYRLLPREYHYLQSTAVNPAHPARGEPVPIIKFEGGEGTEMMNPSAKVTTSEHISADEDLIGLANLVRKLQQAADKIVTLEAQLAEKNSREVELEQRVTTLQTELDQQRVKGREQLMADLLAKAAAIKI